MTKNRNYEFCFHEFKVLQSVFFLSSPSVCGQAELLRNEIWLMKMGTIFLCNFGVTYCWFVLISAGRLGGKNKTIIQNSTWTNWWAPEDIRKKKSLTNLVDSLKKSLWNHLTNISLVAKRLINTWRLNKKQNICCIQVFFVCCTIYYSS